MDLPEEEVVSFAAQAAVEAATDLPWEFQAQVKEAVLRELMREEPSSRTTQ